MILLETILHNYRLIPKGTVIVLENWNKKKEYLLKQLEDYDNPEEILDWIVQADPVAVKTNKKRHHLLRKY